MELSQTEKIRQVVAGFALAGELKSVRAFGNGHIHDTYLIETSCKPQAYILQCFNHQVFTQPQRVMQNIQQVTTHLQRKGVTSPQLVLTKEENTHCIDKAGNYWRVLTFITNT